MRIAPRHCLLAFAAGVSASLALAAPASGQTTAPTPVGPWDGQNPFNCLNQDVGTGTDFPDPDADPFCVEFDKTSQNVSELGIAEFLANEPARVAAAVEKCFYFQRDHWTGSIVQGEDPELWHWDGSYFFDKAKGVGGAHLTNFRIGGVPQDATPYVPPEYHPYLSDTGGGGAMILLESDPDPSCGARVDTPAEREEIYRSEPRYRDCISPGGQVRRRRIGRVGLGLSRERVWARLGPPRKRGSGVHRWCVVGGSSLRVGFHRRGGGRGDGGAARGVSLVRTDNPGHSFKRVGPRTKRRRAIRRLGLRPRIEIGATEVFAAPAERRRVLLAGIRGRRVRWLALADPSRISGDRGLRRSLRGSG